MSKKKSIAEQENENSARGMLLRNRTKKRILLNDFDRMAVPLVRDILDDVHLTCAPKSVQELDTYSVFNETPENVLLKTIVNHLQRLV